MKNVVSQQKPHERFHVAIKSSEWARMHELYWNQSEWFCGFFLALENADHGKYLELRSDMG